jgi:hypothetical protein
MPNTRRQTVYASLRRCAAAPLAQITEESTLEIVIDSSVDWEGASAVDIQRLLDDVTGQLTRHLSSPPLGKIIVSFQPAHPEVKYRTAIHAPYLVLLAVKGLLWNQYAYQFAHEFCHIVCKYERLRKLPNKWFQETICEVASIFVLRQMAKTWLSHPPYPNWINYVQPLYDYAENRIVDPNHQLPANMTLNQWFLENKVALRNNSYLRPMNTLVAIHLLPLFEKNPEHWESVRYLPDSSGNFLFFLSRWQKNVPKTHKSFVQQVAAKFSTAWNLKIKKMPT